MVQRFFDLLRHCRQERRLYFWGLLALLAVDLLDTATPKITQFAIQHLEGMRDGRAVENPILSVAPDSWHGPSSPAAGLWIYGVAYVILVGATGFFRYYMSMGFGRASIRTVYRLRGRLFASLQRQDASWHDRSKIGDQMSLATNDTEAVRMFYGIGLLLLFDTAFYFLLVPAWMSTISVKLMIASAVVLPLIPLVVAKISNAVEIRSEAVQEQFGVLSERARESFAGARVVKSFAREEYETARFARESHEYLHRGIRYAKLSSLQNALLPLMLGLADLVVVAYGGYLVLTGNVKIGAFVAFFQYLIRLSGPMIGLGWTISLYQRARVSMDRIEAAMAVTPSIRDPERPVRPAAVSGAVEFRNVTFAYGDGEPVLREVSFSVPPGGTLGVVGGVGSGKTTLLNLVPRIYDPPPGSVFVDGHDVRSFAVADLRRAIGVVPQEPFLFAESVRTNVAAGIPPGETADGRVEAALRTARIEEDVLALPNRYETMLGERGVNLSGGQKQRVSIARALARRPSILLLDDCLSAVDVETEDRILDGMRAARKDRTAIIVSHRISAVRDADEIIVLDHGRIVERGTHDELVALGGIYADLERKQRIESALEDGDGGRR